MANYTDAVLVYSGGTQKKVLNTDTVTLSGAITAGTGSAFGDITIANGSITTSAVDNNISFGDDNLSTSGTLDCGVLTASSGSEIGNLTLQDGQITDSSGAISFGNENLTTTGDLSVANASVSGNLTVVGDIISGGAMDVLVTDQFLDLAFVAAASGTTAVPGGFTVSQNRASGFTAGTVSSFTANAGSGASFKYSDSDVGGSVTGTALAAGDVIAITGSEEGGNNGLFIVDGVSGTAGASGGQTVVIRSTGAATSGAPPAACPWAQNAFETATGQTGVAMKVDLAVVAIADGAGFPDAGGTQFGKGSFITSCNGTGTVTGGSVVGDWTGNGAYSAVEADVSLQEAYQGGGDIETANAIGALRIECDSNSSGFLINGDAAGVGDVAFGKTGGITNHPINLFFVETGTTVDITSGTSTAISSGSTAAITAGSSLDLSATTTATLDAGGANALSIGCDDAVGNTGAINIGTNAQARVIAIGNAASSSLSLEAGIGALNMAADAASTWTMNGGLTVNSDDAVAVNSSGGTIGIGTGNNNFAIDIGTDGERAIGIGQGAANCSVNIEGADIDIGTETSAAAVITLGESSRANTISLDAGTSTLTAQSDDALTLDTKVSSQWAMQANVASVQTLSIKATNADGGGAGMLALEATTDITLDAGVGSIVMTQGQITAGEALVTGDIVFMKDEGETFVELMVAEAAGDMTQLAGVVMEDANDGDPVELAAFHGGFYQVINDGGVQCGDVLYLGAKDGNRSTVTATVPTTGSIIRVGVAQDDKADGQLTIVHWQPEFVANI